ncbi:MAG: hypothetical protein AAGC60_23995 [Acidobacteriota bacterium]
MTAQLPALLAAVFATGLAMSASAAIIPPCPTPSNDEEAKVLGVALDGYDRYGVSCLRQIKDEYPQHFVNVSQISKDFNGSWNKPQMKWAANALDNGDAVAKSRLAGYSVNQLDADYGLWGKELTSWLYWWPLPTMGLVYEDITDASVRGPLRPLMQAHVGFLSLFSTGDRILTPSVRTLPNSGAHDASLGQDFFLKHALGLMPQKPHNADIKEWGWPFRVTENLTHGYMSSTIKSRYLTNYLNGGEIDWVVAKLNALGVTTRTTMRIWRYANGNFATLLEQNLHGTKDPVYAVTRINGTIHVLGPKRCNGNPQAWLDTTAQLIRDTCSGSIPAPPPTALVYEVRIDGSGVTRVQ